jgi:hypothetical protein
VTVPLGLLEKARDFLMSSHQETATNDYLRADLLDLLSHTDGTTFGNIIGFLSSAEEVAGTYDTTHILTLNY